MISGPQHLNQNGSNSNCLCFLCWFSTSALIPLTLLSGAVQEQFLEKIDYELAEKIRVVSCQSFSFPIWIDNVVIPVKVGKQACNTHHTNLRRHNH